MKTYLAIDAGTTAIKILLADEEQRPLFAQEAPVIVDKPSPSAAETDMDAYWQALCSLLRSAASRCPDAWKHLQGICAAGQGDGLWPLDENGTVFMPAILWQDSRAVELCSSINDPSQNYQSNRLQPGCRSILLAWLKAHEPERYRKITYPLGCVSFLNYRLTGCVTTDASSCGDCFDIISEAYVPALFDVLKISECFPKMPPILPCSAVIGHVTHEAAAQTGIPEGVAVYNGCLDATAAVMGEERMDAKHVSVCVGTTLMVMAAQYEPPTFPLPDGVYADKLPYSQPLYRICFAPKSGASAIAAEKAVYAPDMSYEEMYRHIETIPMGSDELTFLPFLHGERSPFYCPRARSGYFGKSSQHTKWHHMRAAVEGVLFTAKHCLDLCGDRSLTVKLSGGAARSPVFCQTAADIWNIPVEVEQGVYAGVNGCLSIMQQENTFLCNRKCENRGHLYIPDSNQNAAAVKAYQKYRKIVAEMLPVWNNSIVERR